MLRAHRGAHADGGKAVGRCGRRKFDSQTYSRCNLRESNDTAITLMAGQTLSFLAVTNASLNVNFFRGRRQNLAFGRKLAYGNVELVGGLG